MVVLRIVFILGLGWTVSSQESLDNNFKGNNKVILKHNEFESYLNGLKINRNKNISSKNHTILLSDVEKFSFFANNNNLFYVAFENGVSSRQHENDALSLGIFRIILSNFGSSSWSVFSDVFEGYKSGDFINSFDSNINIVKYGKDIDDFVFGSKIVFNNEDTSILVRDLKLICAANSFRIPEIKLMDPIDYYSTPFELDCIGNLQYLGLVPDGDLVQARTIAPNGFLVDVDVSQHIPIQIHSSPADARSYVEGLVKALAENQHNLNFKFTRDSVLAQTEGKPLGLHLQKLGVPSPTQIDPSIPLAPTPKVPQVGTFNLYARLNTFFGSPVVGGTLAGGIHFWAVRFQIPSFGIHLLFASDTRSGAIRGALLHRDIVGTFTVGEGTAEWRQVNRKLLKQTRDNSTNAILKPFAHLFLPPDELLRPLKTEKLEPAREIGVPLRVLSQETLMLLPAVNALGPQVAPGPKQATPSATPGTVAGTPPSPRR